MAEVRFSDLLPLDSTTITDSDLFAVSDNSETASKKIEFGELKEAIVSTDFFTSNAGLIVDALNAHDDNPSLVGTINDLNATRLYHDTGLVSTSGYKTGDYFLNYDNFTNTPDIPVNLTQLSNDNNYIQFDEPNSRLIRQFSIEDSNGNVTTQTATEISTRYVTENTNLYYTDERVDDFFVENFGRFYNQFTAAFDNGLIRDSLLDTAAEFQSVTASQSSIVEIPSADVFENYQKGQTLRIFGASLDDSIEDMDAYEQSGFSLSANRAGFVEAVGAKPGTVAVDFSYRAALFDLQDGKISKVASTTASVEIAVPTESSASDVYEQFNSDYFIRVQFSNIPAGKGIALYRQQGGDTTYKLTAVLGPKETVNNQWIDYFTFDYTTWSGKDGEFSYVKQGEIEATVAIDNTYATVIHFPVAAPTQPQRGWADVQIETSTQNTVADTTTLTLSSALYVNTNRDCTLCHNDTSIIQSAINANAAIGRKNILLNAKTYISDGLEVPSKFGLEGTTAVTKIIRLPWSGGQTGVLNNKMIKSLSDQGAETITLVGFDLDGNVKNSFLYNDVADGDKNYAIDLGINPIDVTIDRVRVFDVAGGGVYSPGITNLKITTCDFLNSGLSDRYEYNPIVADAAFTTLITSCRFENYTGNVNVSLTDKGVVANNIINNCGSGLFIYGSRFFVSSPNVLIGPANEFLPTPDSLNSEYDVINVDLTEAYLSSDLFSSDQFVYQENGSAFNLLQTASTNYNSLNPTASTVVGTLSFESFALKKSGTTGVEEIYSPQNVTSIPLISNTTYETRAEGIFGFQIPQADVASVKKAPFIVDANPNEDLNFSGSTITSTTTDLSGFLDGDSIEIVDSDQNNGLYTINGDSTSTTLTVDQTFNGVTNSGGKIFQTSVGNRSFTAMYARDNDHIGWAWSASYEQQVKAADITGVTGWLPQGTNAGEFDYAGTGVPETDAIYQILVTDVLSGYLAPSIVLDQGTPVAFNGFHAGWSNQPAGNSANQVNTGEVYSIVQNGSSFVVQIRFNGSVSGQTVAEAITASNLTNGQNIGQINITDKFVLAQGRIL